MPLNPILKPFRKNLENTSQLLLPENKYAVFSANRNVSKSENSDA